MDLKKFIETHKCINAAGLAATMWPHLKNPATNISHKLNNIQAGTGRKRITKKDTEDAIKILKKMAKDIEKIQYKDDSLEKS